MPSDTRTPSANSASWANFRHVLRESVGLIGWWMTLRYMLIWLLSYKPFADTRFDRAGHVNPLLALAHLVFRDPSSSGLPSIPAAGGGETGVPRTCEQMLRVRIRKSPTRMG